MEGQTLGHIKYHVSQSKMILVDIVKQLYKSESKACISELHLHSIEIMNNNNNNNNNVHLLN